MEYDGLPVRTFNYQRHYPLLPRQWPVEAIDSMSPILNENPAELASRIALEAMFACLDSRNSFRLEAGAGAGKTYSLVKALRYLIDRSPRPLSQRQQQIACITYTNVAKDEIIDRTDRNPMIYCETTHAFCWSLISGFQQQLRSIVATLPEWQEKIAEAGGDLGQRAVEYNFGRRSIKDDCIMLHHDDVIPLTIRLMENLKFRKILTNRFPIILIDEYQDTNTEWVEAIKTHFIGKADAPLFGFFGDHWQKIYGDGCGSISHASIAEIGKGANFRSVQTIVDCLNRMRPELTQVVRNPEASGSVRIYQTNSWSVTRRSGAHWAGDLPVLEAHRALVSTRSALESEGWDFAPTKTKILMLTHKVMASEQGYPSMPEVFQYNDSFLKKEQPHIAFLIDILEPACEAYLARQYGSMFSVIGKSMPPIRSISDKIQWSSAMDRVIGLRERGTVGQVIDCLRETKTPRLPKAIEMREQELENFNRSAGEGLPRALNELEGFRAMPYVEVIALRRYLIGHSPFETKHGVKGAEFENILVVLGRGWSRYNFSQMLELAGTARMPAASLESFERNRNLFYVVCSRPKTRLALLFTQELSPQALGTLGRWFGSENIVNLVST
jgi:DNA helicase-2/ATP-dependent DNA helicase PcrA